MSTSNCSSWSLIARRPVAEVVASGQQITVDDGRVAQVRKGSVAGAIDLVERAVQNEGWTAIGYISYEGMLEFVGVKPKKRAGGIADTHFLMYDTVLRCDQEDCRSGDIGSSATMGIVGRPSVRACLPWAEYAGRVGCVKEHIREGDMYQANLTTRFDVVSDTPPDVIYARLRRMNPAPFAAYMNMGDVHVLSSSPERMFVRRGEYVLSSPIKGTIRRGSTPDEDHAATQRLLSSQKDRAELLMIVDLVRNDLGKIAQTGTVHVEELFRTEPYASVIHLVSDISARVAREVPLSEVCRALLPGGSITGAPKRRAVEIVQTLEPVPRGVYTGCIGYISPEQSEFNIAIRTMTFRDGVYHVHAGGGIVADSNARDEYAEMRDKCSVLLKALGVPLAET